MYIVLVYYFISWFSEICQETATNNSNMQDCYWKYILVCHPDSGVPRRGVWGVPPPPPPPQNSEGPPKSCQIQPICENC